MTNCMRLTRDLEVFRVPRMVQNRVFRGVQTPESEVSRVGMTRIHGSERSDVLNPEIRRSEMSRFGVYQLIFRIPDGVYHRSRVYPPVPASRRVMI